ncbi:hemagglutinin repeat-containing protein [Bordetella avium]|uniref:hemagglutinin repeat-containing protein n=1 Tax=Bordetella avium TaxID=521 RepID=UPI003B831EA8
MQTVAGDLRLLSHDTLRNSGRIVSGQSLSVQAGHVDNTGAGTLGAREIVLSAQTLYNAGAIQAGPSLSINTGAAQALADGGQTLPTAAATLHNSGQIRSQGELRAHSLGALLNTGQIVGGQLLAVQANHLDNSGALQAQDLALAAQTLNNAGQVRATQDLLAQTPGALANTGRIEAQRRLDIATGTYANTGVMAGQDTRLSTSQPLTLDARAAAPQAGSALRISSPSITVAAPLASPAALTLQATEGDLDNASAITAGQTLVLRAQGAIRNRTGALIWSAQDLGLASQDLLNARHGLIYAQGAMAIEARGQLINRLGRIESGAAMQIDTPDLQNLAEVSGDVRVDPSQGGRVRGARYSVGRFLRSAHLQIGDFSGGDIVSTLQAEQGVIHAGGAMAVNQGARHGQPNQVLNQGRLTAQGQQDIDAQVRNTSPFKPLSLIDYFQRIPVPYEIWDSAASLSPIVRKQSLYALLDHALTRHPEESDNWYKIWGLYDYKNAWLGTALALTDMRQAPALSSALAQALGGDWRGLSEDERSQRWQALIQGERGGILPIYPAQTAVIGGNQGVTIQGGLQNGEAMPAHLEAGLDPALRAAMQAAKQGWKPLPATPATSSSPSPAPTHTNDPQADPATPPEGANHATPGATPSPALFAERDDFADTLAQLLANNHLFGHAGPVGAVPTPYYETRVPFVDPSRFYGSAYFFERVGYRPQAPMYVAGDNYFDDRFIRRQAERLMGAQLSRMPHTNLARQLMDNAAQAQAALGLQVGVAPTAEQLARLQDDIVWYTWNEIDGQSVLMPQVYLGQGTRAQPAVGAALASAGDIRVEGGAIQQNNAWIAGRTVRLQAGANDVQIVNSDGVRGGVQADEAVDIAGRNLYIKGGVIQGKTVTLAAQHRLEIVTGRAADGQGQFRRDTHTGVFAGDSLSAQAGQDLLMRGAQLAGERVALQANNAYLGEVRQASGQREHHFNSDFLTLFFAESNARHTQNQGAGSTIQADTLDLNIGHDLGLLGGQIQARRTTGQIGGDLVAVASARHTRSTQQDIAFELMIGARAGAGGQEASATANQYSGHKSAAGQGAMSGAEARTGISFSYAHAHSQTTTHHNAQLNLGAGRLEVGGRLDLGGADINADRAQDTAPHAGTLAISAQAIESTRYLDTANSQEESGGFFVGLKANARSSLLDVATHIGTTAQQGQQAEVDPGLTALQAVGDVSNLVLNDTGEVSASLGAELSYGRSDHHQQSENSHILGGNLHLTSTQGDIELVGARFAGGESVVLDAAHALHIRSAQSTESASSQSHSLSGYMNYSASCNAVQGACGASGNVSLGGSHTTSQLEARRYANSQIQAQHITLKSGGDTNLIGTRAQADQALTVQAGGSLRLETRQDHQRSASNGGDWSLSAGAGVNTRTLGAVLFNAGVTVHHEHDNYDTTTQAAGLHAGQRLTMRVGRDAALTGAAITAAGPGSSVDIGGKLIARTLQASRDHDGGYGGASAGISQSSSLPTLILNAGRIAGEHYAATLNATVDIGQTQGNGTLQAAIEGPLMQQADRQEVVQHKRRWAQNDIQITFSKLDVGSKQAKQKMARGELDGLTAMDFKRNRVGKIAPAGMASDHDGMSAALRAPVPDEAGPAGAGTVLRSSSPDVERSDMGRAEATLERPELYLRDAGLGPKRDVNRTEASPASVVTKTSSASGADVMGSSADEARAGPVHPTPAINLNLARNERHQDGTIVTQAAGAAAMPEARIVRRGGVAIAQNDSATQLVVLAHGGWKAKTREKTRFSRQKGDGYFSLPDTSRIDFYSQDGSVTAGKRVYDEVTKRPHSAKVGLEPVPPFTPEEVVQLSQSRDRPLEKVQALVEAWTVRRGESAQGGSHIKNYALYRHPEVDRKVLAQHHEGGRNPDIDLAIVTDPRHKVSLKHLLDVAHASHGPYEVVHFAACRTCRDSTDKYDRRSVVVMHDDPLVEQAARRLARKHPDNTDLMRRLPTGELQMLSQASAAKDGRVKVQLLGHGMRDDQGRPGLGGVDVEGVAATLLHLGVGSPKWPSAKVALVGCHTSDCGGLDEALRRQLQSQLLYAMPDIRGYASRIEVNEKGAKRRVQEGGLGNAAGKMKHQSVEGAAPRLVEGQGARKLHQNAHASLSQSGTAKQLLICAHGAYDPDESVQAEIMLPADTRMDFYAKEGDVSTALPRFLIPQYPLFAELGFPAITPDSRQYYRKKALQQHKSFGEILKQQGEAARRKEVAWGGILSKITA